MLEILKMGGYLGAANSKNVKPIMKIPARVLRKFLNSRLKQVKNGEIQLESEQSNHTAVPIKEGFGNNGEKFNFDCQFLIPPESDKTVSII